MTKEKKPSETVDNELEYFAICNGVAIKTSITTEYFPFNYKNN